MLHNCKTVRRPAFVQVHGVHEMLTSEPMEFEGRILSKTKYVLDDPATRYAEIEPKHFYLENLLSTGVELKDLRMKGSDLVATTKATAEFVRLHDLSEKLRVESKSE